MRSKGAGSEEQGVEAADDGCGDGFDLAILSTICDASRIKS